VLVKNYYGFDEEVYWIALISIRMYVRDDKRMEISSYALGTYDANNMISSINFRIPLLILLPTLAAPTLSQ